MMKRVPVQMPVEMHEFVKAKARENEESVASYIRRLIQEKKCEKI